jgi:anaerobic ribonucleoside-triphosphate reductase activating protein
MHIAAIQWPVFSPYLKSTVEIYVSGCNRNCKGCHNPELQNFEYGEELDIEKLVNYLKEREEFFSIISITGGDLLEQNPTEAFNFIKELKINFPTKIFYLFTGDEKEKCLGWVLDYFDYIKVGCYDEKLKQEGFHLAQIKSY